MTQFCGEKSRVANWMQKVQAIGDNLVQFPWEMSVLCLTMVFHVGILLWKFGNSWCKNARTKIWALSALSQ